MKLLAALSVFVISGALAQTGPGGIGNSTSNGLWLRADALGNTNGAAVGSWLDRSGNSNDAIQSNSVTQPVYFSTSSLNNMPVVRFDGNNDEMIIPDANILDGSSGITYYSVIRPNNLDGQARGILGKRITYTVSVEYAYTWFFWGSNQLNVDVHTNNDRFATASSFSNASNYILALDFDGSLPSSRRTRVFSNGIKISENAESSVALPNSNQDLALGALNSGYGTYLGADYAEIIQFNYSLDTVEHIIVQNYLSAKYNIPLGVNDVYNEDDNGNYDFDVAGIGRIGSVSHTDAQGSGSIRFLNPDNLDPNEFMMWGHNNGNPQAINKADVPAGVQARMDRVWRVSEVNTSGSPVDVGSIDMRWNLTGFGAVTASDLRLLIDTDNDGMFSDETPVSGAVDLGGNIFAFNGITQITDNARLTLASINTIQTPLPIELINFSAHNTDHGNVKLEWATASERNNASFTIERSSNGSDWMELEHIQGSGNSSNIITYGTFDNFPLQGVSYYRLRQTDFDGTFSYSQIERISLKPAENVSAYPNPTTDMVYIDGLQHHADFRIFDGNGREITRGVRVISDQDKIQLDLTEVPTGFYFLKAGDQTIKLIKR